MPGTDGTILLRSLTLDKDKGKALPFLSALNPVMIKQGFNSCSTDERSVVSKAEGMYDYALLLDTLRKKISKPTEIHEPGSSQIWISWQAD